MMNASCRSPWLSVVRLLIVSLALVLALTGPWWPGTTAAQAAACPDEIRVGLVFPTTGREGRPGTYQVEGIKLAMEQINASGGVNVKACGKRLPFKEFLYDDQSDQGRSVQLAERTMSSATPP